MKNGKKRTPTFPFRKFDTRVVKWGRRRRRREHCSDDLSFLPSALFFFRFVQCQRLALLIGWRNCNRKAKERRIPTLISDIGWTAFTFFLFPCPVLFLSLSLPSPSSRSQRRLLRTEKMIKKQEKIIATQLTLWLLVETSQLQVVRMYNITRGDCQLSGSLLLDACVCMLINESCWWIYSCSKSKCVESSW